MPSEGLTPIKGYGRAKVSPAPIVFTQSVTPSLGSFEDIGGSAAFFYNSLSNIFGSGMEIFKVAYLAKKKAEDDAAAVAAAAAAARDQEEASMRAARKNVEAEKKRKADELRKAKEKAEQERIDIEEVKNPFH
jgi:hypothetical protein